MDSQNDHPPLRRQAPWVVACRVIGILATLAANVLAARVLGPAEFGRYLFLFSVAACGSLIGASGLNDAVLRFSSENLALGRTQLAIAYVRRVAQFGLISTLLAAGVTAGGLFLFHLATGQLSQPALQILLAVLAAVAMAWQQLAAETLRGWHRLRLTNLSFSAKEA